MVTTSVSLYLFVQIQGITNICTTKFSTHFYHQVDFWIMIFQPSFSMWTNIQSFVLLAHSPTDQPQDVLVPAGLGEGQGSHAAVVLPVQVDHGLLDQVAHHLLQLPVHGEVKGSPAASLLPGLNVNALVDHELDQGEQVLLNSQVQGELAKV